MVAQRHPTRHDRESITTTALNLLDEVGLPDLSMRRLANELGVQPSALYWHFANKQELLAAVADRILARLNTPTSSTSSDAAVSAARGIRDALLAYRDGAEIVMSSYALGFGADHAHAALVDALSPSPAENADARASVLFQFILGHALVVQQRLHAESYGAAVPSADADPSAGFEATFDLGVRTFLTGVPAS
ncbi:MAG TPA: TetR family transcriptional regulator [Microbacterium sp.]|uniref:TetR family transcriptional regulator n=1 Tax=Microbacterium sp. TaxID=51671 RepID=UPI000ED64795|nr:TetR family transcriptional regulator [Microbacterium sp.]